VRRQALGLFFFVFLAHAWFASAPDWNQAARIGAILTFVEPGPNQLTLRIDEFVHSDARNLKTGDWARGADGHYYANKAPGVSLIGIPAYAALHALERLTGAEPGSPSLTALNAILLNLWCSVAWTAAGSAALYLSLAAFGLTRADALLGALAYAVGTLVFPYDTSLWGHTTAAACLLSALCLASRPGDSRHPWLTGSLGGLAVLIEYAAVFGLAAVGCAFLSRAQGWRRRVQFLAGAAIPLLALLIHQKLAFGGYLTTAVELSNPALLDGSRAFGVFGGIDWAAVRGLLFSTWRGLFVYSPILLFAFVGAWQQWRRGRRMLVTASLGSFLACVLFVATLSIWWGGWSSGPRYLIVAIPMLALLAPRVAALPRWARAVHCAALALSASNMFALTAVGVMADEAERNPLYGLAYRALLSGENLDNVNLGMLLGFGPRWSLAAFLLVFGTWTLLLLRSARAAPDPSLRVGA
jgi:hypothetical protein